MEHYQFAVTVSSLGAATLLFAVLLVRKWRLGTSLRRRNAVLASRLQMCAEELEHLAGVRLPELMDHLHDRSFSLSGPLYEQELRETALERALQSVMELFAGSVQQSKGRADQSAKATLRAMMRTVQSLANEQQLDISAMQERHDDPDVLEDLLKIDHMNAQLGRRAQATAVLCGSWPGQQRSASSLSDVARGATSRVRDYLRVKIPAQVNIAVVGRAVEPVVLALAELLDNATRHSAPDTTVEVNFHSTHNGVAVTIDDAGVAMDAEELTQAARLLSGDQPVHINRLGDPPQIGFAVIGVLARRYGFSVSVDTRSPYGGVRAVLFLPTPLLTRTTRPAETAVATPAARAAGAVPASHTMYAAPLAEPLRNAGAGVGVGSGATAGAGADQGREVAGGESGWETAMERAALRETAPQATEGSRSSMNGVERPPSSPLSAPASTSAWDPLSASASAPDPLSAPTPTPPPAPGRPAETQTRTPMRAPASGRAPEGSSEPAPEQTPSVTAGGLPKRRRLTPDGQPYAGPASAGQWPAGVPTVMGGPGQGTGAPFSARDAAGHPYAGRSADGGPAPADPYTGRVAFGPPGAPRPEQPGRPARSGGHPGRHARQTAAGMGAWQRGTRSGRAARPSKGDG